MADYTALAATTLRLIRTNGRDVTLIKQGNQPQDSDKPWRGESAYPLGSVSGKGLFATSSQLGHALNNIEGLKKSEKVVLFPASYDEGELLEHYDMLLDGEVSWRITHVEVLQPGDTRLLYLFGVNR